VYWLDEGIGRQVQQLRLAKSIVRRQVLPETQRRLRLRDLELSLLGLPLGDQLLSLFRVSLELAVELASPLLQAGLCLSDLFPVGQEFLIRPVLGRYVILMEHHLVVI
jgi:hypothetical protein